MKCKIHRWHFVVIIDNDFNKDFGHSVWLCDKCGKKKLVKCNWLKKRNDK